MHSVDVEWKCLRKFSGTVKFLTVSALSESMGKIKPPKNFGVLVNVESLIARDLNHSCSKFLIRRIILHNSKYFQRSRLFQFYETRSKDLMTSSFQANAIKNETFRVQIFLQLLILTNGSYFGTSEVF